MTARTTLALPWTLALLLSCGGSTGLVTDDGGGSGTGGSAVGGSGGPGTGGAAGAGGRGGSGAAGGSGGTTGAGGTGGIICPPCVPPPSNACRGTGPCGCGPYVCPDAGAPLPAIRCPDMPPAAGTPCARAGLACQYGDDPRQDCRLLATCAMPPGSLTARWDVLAPRCVMPPKAMCPATRQDAAGKACSPIGAYCAYEQGLFCLCTNCRTGPVDVCGGDPVWRCDTPSPVPGCPAAMPNLGTSCAQEGLSCMYTCDSGRLCQGGIWVRGHGGICPIAGLTRPGCADRA